ncbi:MAG: SDR family oxidoreductase [Arenicellales bacterium]
MADLDLTMRVLVTGHEGYIGAALVPALLQRGHEVTGCDVGLFDACRFVGETATVPNLAKDIRALAPADLEGFDAVIHLAGLSNDPLGNYEPGLTYAINHRATVALARHAVGAGVTRFLFASSCSVYGSATDTMLDEDSPISPVTPYGASKTRAEQELSLLAGERFSPTHIRAGTVYGVSPRIRFDLVLNNLVAWAASTGVVHLKSDGRSWRPLVHVSDVARAYCAILEAPRSIVHNEAFNVGVTSQNFRVHELAEVVRHAVQGSRIEYSISATPDRRNYRVDCDKIQRRLEAFKPCCTVEQGAAELHAALREQPVKPADFEGAGFSRIAHVQQLISSGRLDQDLYWVAPHDR